MTKLSYRIETAKMASCNCMTKSHEWQLHDELCVYRILCECQKAVDDRQKIMDIAFEMIYGVWAVRKRKWFKTIDREGIMEWVAKTFNNCGLPNRPVGSSWGVLID